MGYLYDLHGWFIGEGDGPRATDTAPANISTSDTPGALRANWTGHAWRDLAYVVPSPVIDGLAEAAALRARTDAEREAVGNTAAIRALIRMTPAEIDDWITANVNTIGDARTLFSRICKVVAILARREFN